MNEIALHFTDAADVRAAALACGWRPDGGTTPTSATAFVKQWLIAELKDRVRKAAEREARVRAREQAKLDVS